MRYVVPAVHVNVVCDCVPLKSSLHATFVRPASDEPVYAARTVSKLVDPLTVEMVAVPLPGAVHAYQIVFPMLPHGAGSPVSVVAPTVVGVAEYGRVETAVALPKQ